MESPLYYKLLKPENEIPDKTYPAIFLMHGMGSNEEDLLPLVQDVANSAYIISMRGPIGQPPGYAFFTIEGYGKPHRSVFDDAIQRVIRLVDEICAEYPIDPSAVFLIGFSQGAILAMSIGLTIGERVKGIAALSGYVPEFMKHEYEVKNLRDLSLFISHGEMDPVLPFEWSKEAEGLFEQLEAKVEYHGYSAGHQVSRDNYQDFNKWLKQHIKPEF